MCKAVEDTDAEELGTIEAEGGTNLSTKSNGEIENVLIAIKKGHPSTSFPEAENIDEDAFISSHSSQAKSVTKLTKDFKKMKKAFTQLQ